jgi:hypothetical protein
MNSFIRNNYRMGGYLLIATGLINWQYQNADSGIVLRTALIVLPGVLIIIATFIKSLDKFLANKTGMWLLAIMGLALVALALTN